VLAFGGPYGNREATLALLARAKELGIGGRNLICTGDVAAYCADPEATAGLLREAGATVVLGNCEQALGADAEDCGCGFAAGGRCDTLAAEWYAHCRRALSAGTRRWMAGLPETARFVLGGRHFAVVHGAPGEIARFVFASTPQAEKRAAIDRAGAEAVICGHSGLPFVQAVGAGLWLNAGAIGMPANDGTPRVWCALLTPRPGGTRVQLMALDYDWPVAAARMRAAGLPPAYAETLATGLWDSCEILPPAERAARGLALAPTTQDWLDKAPPVPANSAVPAAAS